MLYSAGALAALLLSRVFFSNANPLWRWYEAYPRLLENQNLLGKLDGLIRVGEPGASWEFRSLQTRDSVTIVKDSPAGEAQLRIEISRETAGPIQMSRFADRATLALAPNERLDVESPATLLLNCASPVRVEAVLRLVFTELEHPIDERYACSSTGPTDSRAIREWLT